MTISGPERWIVRLAVAALFGAAILFAVEFSIHRHQHLPSVALDQPIIYRVEVCLAVVYGGLLLLTPLFYGLAQGKLPNELSHRGAKWPETAAATNVTLARLDTSVQTLRQDSTELRARLIEQELEIKRVALAKRPRED